MMKPIHYWTASLVNSSVRPACCATKLDGTYGVSKDCGKKREYELKRELSK